MLRFVDHVFSHGQTGRTDGRTGRTGQADAPDGTDVKTYLKDSHII